MELGVFDFVPEPLQISRTLSHPPQSLPLRDLLRPWPLLAEKLCSAWRQGPGLCQVRSDWKCSAKLRLWLCAKSAIPRIPKYPEIVAPRLRSGGGYAGLQIRA